MPDIFSFQDRLFRGTKRNVEMLNFYRQLLLISLVGFCFGQQTDVADENARIIENAVLEAVQEPISGAEKNLEEAMDLACANEALEQAIGLADHQQDSVPEAVAESEQLEQRKVNKDDDFISEEISPYNKFSILKIFSGQYYESEYSAINEYLIDHVPNDDPAENMKLAQSWLDAQLGRGAKAPRKTLVAALKQFTALNYIHTKFNCNRNSYAILYKNNQAIRNTIRTRPSNLKPFKRIESIIYQYALQHAIECHFVYPEKYLIKYQSMNRIAVEKVERFMNELIQKRASRKRFFSFSKDNFNPETITSSVIDWELVTIAYHALEKSAKDDPDRIFLSKQLDERDGKFKIVEHKVESLVIEHLVKPCEYYIRELGPDIFIPAKFDIRMLEKEDRYSMEENRDMSEFIYGWLKFRLCSNLVSNNWKTLASKVSRYAARH